MKKKLIEVALPLEAINKESAREKSIRHGHPSTLHLWWARRPLAACRAVIFASLVDDPSSHPDKFPTEEAQEQERQRLFDIIGKIITVEKKGKTEQVVQGLVSWDTLNNPEVIEAAQREIARSIAWNRGEEPPKSAAEIREYLQKYAPPVYDPFCGGGSIPLEAQRLGLEAHGSDLNPVAVLITKALIEIPPKFKDKPPVNPEAQKKLKTARWYGAQGLAEDVRYYGQWMRDEAEKRIGHLYPKITLPQEYGGGEATVIAWLWARTVKCPNPACGAQMPLVRSFALSTKKGKEAWVEPVIDRNQQPPVVKFEVRSQQEQEKKRKAAKTELERESISVKPLDGTMNRKGATCICCGTPVPFDYIRTEGKAERMNARLMAIVAEGQKQRVYISPNDEHIEIAFSAQPEWKPESKLMGKAAINVPLYGMPTYGDLFTNRQLVALTTFSDLVSEAREKMKLDAIAAGIADDNLPLCEDGIGATAYADGVATYLGLGVSKLADALTSLTRWKPSMDQVIATFARQALPMVWDYAESNTFNSAAGDYTTTIATLIRAIGNLNTNGFNSVKQIDATTTNPSFYPLISTDPPYYDNISYADLSDFFYVWLRRSLSQFYPNIFSTLLVPKSQELVATPYRFGGDKQKAKDFFEEGLGKAFNRMRETAHPDYPLTVYYAFKQSESDDDDDDKNVNTVIASTGWETMLEGLIKAGFSITGTLPMRTELSNRTIASGSNALASSIVLVCRPRPDSAPSTTRRQFLNELKRELPEALKNLQQGNIAPVDLAQASIGPGMAIFSRYTKVLDADGSPMRIRTALQLINQMLDEFLTEQEGEFDADTRWALTWFEQNQFNEGLYGDAETLSKAKNTSVQGLVNGGILTAKSGKVRLLRRDELPDNWNPATDTRTSDWETTQYLIRTLDQKGETGAATMLSQLGSRGEIARDLAYRLYNICDRKSWTQEAIAYNSLVISWAEISRLAAETKPEPVQGELF
jgi:putative DNA methylase